MWASIPGLNADRADLDLLDVTIGTFKDASAAVGKSQLGSQALLGATSFNIPMWNGRGNSAPTAAAFELGHATGGVYLPLNDTEYLNTTYVAPMRLEFKVERPAYMRDADWAKSSPRIRRLQVQHPRRRRGCAAGRSCGAECGQVLLLTHLGDQPRRPLPVGQPRDHRRAVHRGAGHPRGFQDGPVHGQSDVLGLEPGSVPRARGRKQRGLFLFGDGTKNAEFSSPDAVYVTAANWISDEKPGTVGGTVPATLALTLGAPASFGPFTPGVAKDYFASTTATVTSTAGDATLTVADPSTTPPATWSTAPSRSRSPCRPRARPAAPTRRSAGPPRRPR